MPNKLSSCSLASCRCHDYILRENNRQFWCFHQHISLHFVCSVCHRRRRRRFCNFLVISELDFIFIVRIVCAGVLYFGIAFFFVRETCDECYRCGCRSFYVSLSLFHIISTRRPSVARRSVVKGDNSDEGIA